MRGNISYAKRRSCRLITRADWLIFFDFFFISADEGAIRFRRAFILPWFSFSIDWFSFQLIFIDFAISSLILPIFFWYFFQVSIFISIFISMVISSISLHFHDADILSFHFVVVRWVDDFHFSFSDVVLMKIFTLMCHWGSAAEGRGRGELIDAGFDYAFFHFDVAFFDTRGSSFSMPSDDFISIISWRIFRRLSFLLWFWGCRQIFLSFDAVTFSFHCFTLSIDYFAFAGAFDWLCCWFSGLDYASRFLHFSFFLFSIFSPFRFM